MITRLLLVDSDIGFMLKFKEALEQTGGFQVSISANTPGATEHLARAYHHCALVTFDLPATDIVQVLRELRNVQPDLLVVVTPANNAEEDRVRFLNVQGTLRKPFTARDAAPYIERVVVRARQRPPIGADDVRPPQQDSPPRVAEPTPANLMRPADSDAGKSPAPGFDLDALDRQNQPAVEDYHAPDGHSILDEFAALEDAQAEPAIPDPTFVDASDWFRNLDPLLPVGLPGEQFEGPSYESFTVPRNLPRHAPHAAPENAPASEAADDDDPFDAIYSDANYADDMPLLTPDMPGVTSEPPDGERADYLPGAYGEPEIEPPDPDETGYLTGAYGQPEDEPPDLNRTAYLTGAYGEPEIEPPDRNATAFLSGAYGTPDLPPGADDTHFLSDQVAPDLSVDAGLSLDSLEKPAHTSLEETRPLGQTAPLDDWAETFGEGVVPPFVLDVTGEDESFRDVLDAMSGAVQSDDEAGRTSDQEGRLPDTGELRNRAFHDLVDTMRTPSDQRPPRSSLDDMMAALDEDPGSDEPTSAIDHLLNAIRSGNLPDESDDLALDSAPEVSDSTIGELIQGLFDSSFEGVLATLAGEDVADDSFQEPSYESLDEEPPRRRLPEVPVSPEDSASYPATTALSAVRGGAADSGEFSLDALLTRIEGDLAHPRRPRLKPLPSWGTPPASVDQTPAGHSIEAMFNHIEGVDQSLKAADQSRYESLLEEFENLTPESLSPSVLAQESAGDVAAPSELLAYQDAEGDPFAQGDEAFARRTFAYEEVAAPEEIAPPSAQDEDWQDAIWPEEEPLAGAGMVDADYVPDLEIPSFVAEYHTEDLQNTDTRPMPIDAGANLDYVPAEPERFADHIPPELAAELGELAEQLSAAPGAPDRPDTLPGWGESPDEWALPAAENAELIDVPADTAAMILSGLDDLEPLETGAEADNQAEMVAEGESQADSETASDDALAEAAVLLTQYALESSAQAVMLARPGAVIALSGELPETAEHRLFALVDAAWNAAPDSSALIRFITLPDAGEFLLYSTLVESGEAGDFSLSMIFHVDTPVRVIRRQAQRLSESLALVPEEPEYDEPITERTLVNRPTEVRAPAGLREAVAAEMAARAGATGAASIPARPEDEIAYTAFTCAWLPADPRLELRDALAEMVNTGLDVVARANMWEVEDRMIGPDVVIVTLRVPETLLTDDVIARLMSAVSELTAEQYPDLLGEGESLWSDGYYLVSPPRPLSEREIGRFINAQREAS